MIALLINLLRPTYLFTYLVCKHIVMYLARPFENVRFCMDMFNSVDVNTMLTKRRQKFCDVFEQLNNLVCQITRSCNCK